MKKSFAIYIFCLLALCISTGANGNVAFSTAIKQAYTTRQNKQNTLLAARTAAISNVTTLNNNLVATTAWEQNEKTVNGIFLATIAVGVFTYTAAQLSTLKGIANQCALSGGEAVLQARSMLAHVEDVPTIWRDEKICGAALRPSDERSGYAIQGTAANLNIYPNPATDFLTIEYSGLSEFSQSNMTLFNAFGQAVGNVSLQGIKGKMEISVKSLPKGIYWYSISGMAPPISSGKIIINH